MNTKAKLNTDIEKVVHKHVDRCTEGAIDLTFLFIRRNNIDVDRDSLGKIVEIFRDSMRSEHLSKLDLFMGDLDKSVTAFVESARDE